MKTKGFQPDKIYQEAHDYIATQVQGEGKETSVHAAAAELAIMLMTQNYTNKSTAEMGKTMSTYEKVLNRMRKMVHLYQNKCNRQKKELIRVNAFIK